MIGPGGSGQNAPTARGKMKRSKTTGEPAQTALAIALSNETADPEAPPRIVATGRGAIAEEIVSIALAHGVKVREDADLAQILSILEVDSIVPVEVLATVSEILSYVYRANAALGHDGES
jgi:flagellar biosynthesis protein